MFEVRVGKAAAEKITRTYGPERSAAGRPSEWDFWTGPLAAHIEPLSPRERRRIIGAQMASASLDAGDETVLVASASDVADASE